MKSSIFEPVNQRCSVVKETTFLSLIPKRVFKSFYLLSDLNKTRIKDMTYILSYFFHVLLDIKWYKHSRHS